MGRARTVAISLGAAGAVGAVGAAVVGGGLAWALLRRRARKADLSGQVVLITGGSRGLGLELARQFSDLGCRVAICGRDVAQLERARQHLVQRRSPEWAPDVYAHRCDVSDRSQVQ